MCAIKRSGHHSLLMWCIILKCSLDDGHGRDEKLEFCSLQILDVVHGKLTCCVVLPSPQGYKGVIV